MYNSIAKEKIDRQLAAIGSEIKKSALLSGSWTGAYAVAGIVIDNLMPLAEVHKNAADVWIALTGTSTFILGGELVEATEVSPGEFTAPTVANGTPTRVAPGDVIDIPARVAHQVDARGGRAEFLIIKIKSAPL